jgi:Ca2+-binding EF-hand superfamily protein
VRSDLDGNDEAAIAGQANVQAGIPSTLPGRISKEIMSAGPEYAAQRLAWLESPWFMALSGLAIILNAVIIGVETSGIDSAQGQFLAWQVEQMLLAFFTVELLLKTFRDGRAFVCGEDWGWNVFDGFIVLSGVFDQWTVPVLEYIHVLSHEKHSSMSIAFSVLRMVRLLRIMRLIRLVKIVRPLHDLALGLVEALHGMFWVLVLLSMSIYTLGIICTEFISRNHLLVLEQFLDDDDIGKITAMFQSVPDSMFSLFDIMSSWSLVPLAPLFEEAPLLRIFFVVFYIYSAWAMLAVMSGVVSDNMIVLRNDMVAEDQRKEEERKSVVTRRLLELFTEADGDQSGAINREEFDLLLSSPKLIAQLSKVGTISPQDLHDLFDWIDHDGSGSIEINEFMAGFRWATQPLGISSLAKISERFSSNSRHMGERIIKVLEERFQELQDIMEGPLLRVQAICQMLQVNDVTFQDVNRLMSEEVMPHRPEPLLQELAAVEERLSEKLSFVRSRLEDLEHESQHDHLCRARARGRLAARGTAPN